MSGGGCGDGERERWRGGEREAVGRVARVRLSRNGGWRGRWGRRAGGGRGSCWWRASSRRARFGIVEDDDDGSVGVEEEGGGGGDSEGPQPRPEHHVRGSSKSKAAVKSPRSAGGRDAAGLALQLPASIPLQPRRGSGNGSRSRSSRPGMRSAVSARPCAQQGCRRAAVERGQQRKASGSDAGIGLDLCAEKRRQKSTLANRLRAFRVAYTRA